MIQTAISLECEDLTINGILAMPWRHKKPVPGVVERDYVKPAMDILRALPGIWLDCIILLGYSFGDAVILGGLKVYKSAKAMGLISPSVAAVEASNGGRDKRPRLFLLSERDDLINWADMREKVQAFKRPSDFHLVF